MARGPWRGGRVHVLREMCSTCVFRPGNLMRLQSGRVRGMVDEALAEDSAITCHSTLYEPGVRPAVCRGFYDRYRYDTMPLRAAEALGLVEEDDVPAKEDQ